LRIYAPEKYTIEIDGKITPLADRHSNEAGSANALSISDRQVPDYILLQANAPLQYRSAQQKKLP
jgi:hypothetical protein